VLGISIGELFESSEDKSAGAKLLFRLLAAAAKRRERQPRTSGAQA
jgi:hypothetical protein